MLDNPVSDLPGKIQTFPIAFNKIYYPQTLDIMLKSSRMIPRLEDFIISSKNTN